MIYTKQPISEVVDTSLPYALTIKFENGEEFPLVYTNNKELVLEFQLTEDSRHRQVEFTNPTTGETVALTFRKLHA